MKCGNERGEFTFVEAMVVAVIFSLVTAAVYMMSNTGNRVWVHMDDSMANITSAQIALDRLTEDLRQASSGAGLTCAADRLQFTVGTNQITYTRVGSNLRKQVGTGVPTTVAGGLAMTGSAPPFNPTCDPVNHVVKVQLTAQASSLRPALQKTVESQVWVQNP